MRNKMRFRAPGSGDVIAGFSVALVAIPQALAYAELAGLPAQHGLYAAALPSVIAAIFASSRYLQTGPVALTALLTFGALSSVEEPTTLAYVKLAALLAVLVGTFRLLLGVARLGRLAYLLSEPVLTGFTTGAAVLIIASQFPRVIDAAPEDAGVLEGAIRAFADVGSWQWQALAFAAMTALLVVGGRRVHRLFPGVLVAVVGATAVSALVGYRGSVAGELSGGMVTPSVDLPWSSTGSLLVPAFVIALVGFAEPASIARTFAIEEREPWDADREMLGQGMANLAAGFTQAFPVGGSFSRSSLNRLAGATSPWAGAVTGLVVLATLPLTPLLETLPSAVLGAIVLVSVVGLLKFADLLTLTRQSVPQAVVAIGTLAATLAFAPRVERGVLFGIVLAMGVHLYREMSVSADSERRGDTLTVSPKGVMWFATVPNIDRVIRDELAGHPAYAGHPDHPDHPDHPALATVVLDLRGVGRLDYSGAAALARIAEELQQGGVVVRVENVPPGAARSVNAHLSKNRV